MDELEAMLRRVFVDQHADCIVVSIRCQQRQIQSVGYGVAQGWLRMTVDNSDEQSTACVYRLTSKGRKHFFPKETQNAK